MTAIVVSPEELAEFANLRYVTDSTPGLGRRRHGRGFVFVGADSKRIKDTATLERIRALVIPPAWRDVWICPSANGHLQVTGFDDRGRKQYLYHPRWSEVSNRTKFARMPAFGKQLARIRRRVKRDIASRKFSRNKVVATVVEILDRTAIRIGNREYASDNNSFGATTLKNRHVKTTATTIHFRFPGKSGQLQEVELKDRRIAKVVRCCEEIPGQQLFQFCEVEGEYQAVESTHVNEYLREIAGEAFTAKDIRTWRASAVATGFLADQSAPESEAERQRTAREAYKLAAATLGNTITVCRKYYVHPAIVEAYVNGTLPKLLKSFRVSSRSGLDRDEQLLMHFLKRLTPRPRRSRRSSNGRKKPKITRRKAG